MRLTRIPIKGHRRRRRQALRVAGVQGQQLSLFGDAAPAEEARPVWVRPHGRLSRARRQEAIDRLDALARAILEGLEALR